MLRFTAQNGHVIDTHFNFEPSGNGAITMGLLFGNIRRLQRKRVQSSEGSLELIAVLPKPVNNPSAVPTSADANHLRWISTSISVADWWLLTLLVSVVHTVYIQYTNGGYWCHERTVIVPFLQWTGALKTTACKGGI